ncbi:MAG TPA: fumarylacetoacetate hydrolase family protein [Pedococcus sp.]|nr:fumarylacetoacetate hydrolase family protein [Pedococcus sp.]
MLDLPGHHDQLAQLLDGEPASGLAGQVPRPHRRLIFTGTPGGVGNRRTPPCFLRPGEVLVSRLEGVGELRQSFTA